MENGWQSKLFSELSNDELYDLLKLRVNIFVVEQKCYYPELDDLDRHPDARHLMFHENEKLVAYLRALPPNLVYPGCASIGRVLTGSDARGSGLGRELLRRGIELCGRQWPDSPIKIAAQKYLEKYYAREGFVSVSDTYLEDGIPHIDMLREINN